MYAIFYTINLDNKPSQLLGSDGCLPLDRRYKTVNQHRVIYDHITKLNAQLNKGIIGYSIITNLRETGPDVPQFILPCKNW